MSFFKNLFKGKKEQDIKKEQIVPLTNGELVNISQVPDEVFSSKMMGDGFAMKTKDGIIVSPVEGTIVTVFPTKHAVTINSVDGREVLIHLGVDTVSLKGEGFETRYTLHYDCRFSRRQDPLWNRQQSRPGTGTI